MSHRDRLLTAVARGSNSASGLIGRPRLNILVFHRVHAQSDPLFPGEVDAVRFDRMMSAVSEVFQVMPLRTAVQHLASSTLPRSALAITFDDGYADNAEIALPILKRHGLPATFYVATGFLDGGRMWNDTVIECFRHTNRPTVDLTAMGLGVVPTETPAQKRAGIDCTIPIVKYVDLKARQESLQMLHDACGRPPLSDRLMMTRSQVVSLHSAGMEVGAHTVNHPILTTLPDDAAEQELLTGKLELERIIQASVRALAYPNGKPGRDYDARHVAMARSLGFESAVTTSVGVSRYGDDVLQLPRFTPWDRSMSKWLARLLLNQRHVKFETAQAACSSQSDRIQLSGDQDA